MWLANDTQRIERRFPNALKGNRLRRHEKTLEGLSRSFLSSVSSAAVPCRRKSSEILG
jgi:hypothetical protein